MPQDTKVKQLVVNQLSKQQYKQAELDNILSDTEIYIITDDYHYTELEIQTLLATKQDKLIASGKINIDENNIISVDLSDYDSTLGSSLEYENSVLTLVSKNGKTLSNVTIKSTPDVDDATIHLNNSEQLEVIGNITKDGTTKYDWVGTKEEYKQGLTSGLITNTTACYITNDEIDLISGTDISLPTKLSELSNDTNFINTETLNNYLNAKVDKENGKSLIDDTEIVRLSGVTNYNDTQIKQDLLNKVDKVEGKSLIDDTEIVRLSGVTNYDDTSVVNNITDLQINKSNTSLNNLTPEGEKHFLNYSQITNCITEIPQRIKLELNNGTLTLKAGSEVTVPNGFEADGTTPKFDYVTIESDLSISTWGSGITNTCVLGWRGDNKFITLLPTCVFSGATKPTPNVGNYWQWYDTTNNKIKYTADNGATWLNEYCAFPIAITQVTNSAFTSVNQIFNGMGYIGSTVWVDKGVKGLIPNGRNEDGTLNNIEYTADKIYMRTFATDSSDCYREDILFCPFNPEFPYFTGAGIYRNYVNKEGYLVCRDDFIVKAFSIAYMSRTKGIITELILKNPFRAVDYNDKPDLSGLAMPSKKYINLTLGASGTSYIAPTNGYFGSAITSTNTTKDKFFELINVTAGEISSSASFLAGWARAFIPAKKGDKITVYYGGTSLEIKQFRFIYAEGET